MSNILNRRRVASGCLFEDDFEALSTGSLASQGNWSTEVGDVVIVDVSGDNRAEPNSTGTNCAVYNSAALTDMIVRVDLSAQVASNGISPCINLQGGAGQGYQ